MLKSIDMTIDPRSLTNPQEGCPEKEAGWCYPERGDAAKKLFPELVSVTK